MDTYIFLKEASYLYITVLSGLEFLILVCIIFAFEWTYVGIYENPGL